jgi:hypothetical protein
MNKPPTGRQPFMPEFLYRILNNEEFAKRSATVFEKVFGKPDIAELKMPERIMYRFVFDSDYKIVYFRILYPTSAWEEFPRWEEKLYRFGMTFNEVDIKSLTRGTEGEPFTRGDFILPLRSITKRMEGAKMQFEKCSSNPEKY